MENNEEKSANSIEQGQPQKKVLSLFDGISTIVSLMVGCGIFSTAGQIHGGVGSAGLSLLLWLCTGILGLFGALCYAELGTMIPGSGGEAQYLRVAYGPAMAFAFNWTSIIILKPATVSILALACSQYLITMAFRLIWPSLDRGGFSETQMGWIEKIFAILICIIVTLAASFSVKMANRVQSVLTFGKIGALALIILMGAYQAVFGDPQMIRENLGNPFQGSFFEFGKFATAMNDGLWSFEGWNNLNIVAGDLSNPSLNLPLSIWISMISVVSLYLLTLLGYYSVLPNKAMVISETIGIEFGLALWSKWGMILFSILISSSAFGSALSSMITSSEIVVFAANQRQIPKFFSRISPSSGTAVRAYWLQCILAVILLFFNQFDALVAVYTFPTWIFYALCAGVLLHQRVYQPHVTRPYRVFLTTPILFILACIWLLTTSLVGNFLIVGFSFLAGFVGIPIYYLLRHFHGGDKKMTSFNNAADTSASEPMVEKK